MFWDALQAKLNEERPYKANIGAMYLRLQELQETDSGAQKIRATPLQDGWKEVDGLLHHQGLPYMLKIVCFKLISNDYDDLLVRHFGIDKTQELISQKYYWPNLRKGIKTYVQGYNVCLASKTIYHKPYRDLQFLLVLAHQLMDLSIDVVTSLLLSAD